MGKKQLWGVKHNFENFYNILLLIVDYLISLFQKAFSHLFTFSNSHQFMHGKYISTKYLFNYTLCFIRNAFFQLNLSVA